MTVKILCGDIAALPPAEQADTLLPQSGSTLSLACTQESSACSVLRTVMEYGYAHALPADVRLVCSCEAVRRAYTFQWNMWYAECRPAHD